MDRPGPKSLTPLNFPLMQGKRGLIMGIANSHSIAWGIASTLAEHGAELAFTYQSEALERRVRPLAESIGVKHLFPCDVEQSAAGEKLFDQLKDVWGEIDFLVHAVAYSDKAELKGLYADTSRENFLRTLLISSFSFTEITKYMARLMPKGGACLTLTFNGSMQVMPNYNVMGVAKAALEASVRYLANDYGAQNVRVNAISAGPVRTLAGAGIADSRYMYNFQARHAPLRRPISLKEIGGAALYLLSDLSTGVTGEIHFVDSGYHILSMPHPAQLRAEDPVALGCENAVDQES